MSFPTLRLRPPAHRSYLNGYAGVPAAMASPPSAKDPLVDIPHRPTRASATLSGIVEVKHPRSDSDSFKAKWLRVELEKIEVVPKRAAVADDEDDADVVEETKFVELIGMRPEAVWEAKNSSSGHREATKKGLFGRKTKKDNEESEWQVIPEGNYPFTIAVPEGLPASVEVDSAGNGVSYQIVATLCIKTKKGLLKTIKISTITDSDNVLISKSDQLPAWPIYTPVLLPACVPADLPWAASASSGLPTVGDTKQVRVQLRSDDEDSELVVKGYRDSSAYGPGDTVQLAVELMWPGYETLKISLVKAQLVEQITFRYPVDDRYGGMAQRAHPKLSTISSDVVDFAKLSSSRSFLHPHQLKLVPLQLDVPPNHSVSTLKAAKFIEASYQLEVQISFEDGNTASLRDWPVTLGPVNRSKSIELVKEIGWTDKYCARPGLSQFQEETRANPPLTANRRSPDLPSKHNYGAESSVRASADYSAIGSLRTETESTRHQNGLNTQHPSLSAAHSHRLSYSTNSHSHSSQSESHRLSSAAEEKRRLHDLATRTRDETQARHAAELAQTRAEKAREERDEVPEMRRQSYQLRDEPATSRLGLARPGSLEMTVASSPTDVGAATMHTASLVPAPSPIDSLDVLRSALAKAPAERTPLERQAINDLLNGQLSSSSTSDALLSPVSPGGGAMMTRSSTTVARQGSVAGSGTDSGSNPSTVTHKDSPGKRQVSSGSSSTQPHYVPPEPLPSAFDLVRSKTKATSAESEKSRLFAAARQEANRRQDEAQSVLDRQSMLEHRPTTRTRLGEEDESEMERLRLRALRERDEIEAKLREQERLDEAEFLRQEQERQIKARQEFEARKRENERKRQLELQALAEQQREREEGSKQAMLQRRREQDRIELERIEAERRMREEEARMRAAEAELQARMEAQAAEDERRRQAAEQERLFEQEQHRLQQQQRRYEEERVRRERELVEQRQAQTSNQWSSRPSAPAQRSQNSFVSQTPQAYADSGVEELQDAFDMRPPRMPGMSNLQRSGSIVSFAPSTSAHEADVSFYAKAIAESHSTPTSSLQQDKAAYLAQLRQRDEARRIASSSSSSSSMNRPGQHSSLGNVRRLAFDGTNLLAPQPSPQKLERAAFDPLLSFGQEMPMASTPVDTARFRFQEAQPQSSQIASESLVQHALTGPSAPPLNSASAPPTLATSADENLPSYPPPTAFANGNGNSSSPQQYHPDSSTGDFNPNNVAAADSSTTFGSQSSQSSAAQEKRALSAYYAAKAAVDAQASSSSFSSGVNVNGGGDGVGSSSSNYVHQTNVVTPTAPSSELPYEHDNVDTSNRINGNDRVRDEGAEQQGSTL
ncbi:hypothetical protein ACM66B_006513 [Microbotryomycetes sp. NB124-2]